LKERKRSGVGRFRISRYPVLDMRRKLTVQLQGSFDGGWSEKRREVARGGKELTRCGVLSQIELHGAGI